MLLLHRLCRQDLSQSLFSIFLEQLVIELFLDRASHRGLGGEAENRARQAATESLTPPENLLLDHLEQSLCVHRTNLHLGLEPPDLVRPGHGLSSQTIRPELHEALVDSVEEAFVLDVDALPDQLGLLARISTLTSNHGLLSCLFYLQVQIHGDDGILLQVLRGFEVLVGSYLRCLQVLEGGRCFLLDGLRELLQELDVVIIVLVRLQLFLPELGQALIVGGEVDLEL